MVEIPRFHPVHDFDDADPIRREARRGIEAFAGCFRELISRLRSKYHEPQATPPFSAVVRLANVLHNLGRGEQRCVCVYRHYMPK